MITVRLKIEEEKKELSNKHPHIMQNTKHKYSGVTIIFGAPYRVAIYVRVSPDTSSF